MTWKRSLPWLLPLVCLLLAGPAALSAEEIDLACLFAAPETENASTAPALQAGSLSEPLQESATCGGCGTCGFEGQACTRFGGAPGICVTARRCPTGGYQCLCVEA